ncbi:hypothetical protein MMC06_003743 [Schaereria dolodes]|nr:hypothetical protein [Schaereria dolodes]
MSSHIIVTASLNLPQYATPQQVEVSTTEPYPSLESFPEHTLVLAPTFRYPTPPDIPDLQAPQAWQYNLQNAYQEAFVLEDYSTEYTNDNTGYLDDATSWQTTDNQGLMATPYLDGYTAGPAPTFPYDRQQQQLPPPINQAFDPFALDPATELAMFAQAAQDVLEPPAPSASPHPVPRVLPTPPITPRTPKVPRAPTTISRGVTKRPRKARVPKGAVVVDGFVNEDHASLRRKNKKLVDAAGFEQAKEQRMVQDVRSGVKILVIQRPLTEEDIEKHGIASWRQE